MANSVSPVGNIARGFFNRFQFGLSASTNNHDGLSNNLSSDEPLALWIDRKLVDKVTRILTKIVKLCQRPKMNLKNNPPYIIDILTQIQHHILTVIQEQRGDLDKLNQIEYLTFYFGNLMKKCKYTTNLFKAAKEKIYDTRTIYRCTLNKMSLIFSHMLTELKAIFPSGQYNIDDYRIVDEGACQFWKESFRSRAIIPWTTFRDALERVHGQLSDHESISLKGTMDLTLNQHISIFEFDIFSRLFQPWATIMHNWNSLAISHPGYAAFLTYDDAKNALEPFLDKPGSYIFRLSCTRLGQWAIAYVEESRNVVQTIPNNKPLRQALIDGFNDGIYLYPAGNDANPDLTLDAPSSQQHMTVTKDQYDIYVNMGSTFELCKICAARNKDAYLEPCGHLMCEQCLQRWQLKGGQECPFCRCRIVGWKKVYIEPFNLPVLDGKANSISDLNTVGASSSDEVTDETVLGATARIPTVAADIAARAKVQNNNINSDNNYNQSTASCDIAPFDSSVVSVGTNHERSNGSLNNVASNFLVGQQLHINNIAYEGDISANGSQIYRSGGDNHAFSNIDVYEDQASNDAYCSIDDDDDNVTDERTLTPEDYTENFPERSNATMNPAYGNSDSMLLNSLGPLPIIRNSIVVDSMIDGNDNLGIYENDNDEETNVEASNDEQYEGTSEAGVLASNHDEDGALYQVGEDDIASEASVLNQNYITNWKTRKVDEQAFCTLIMNGFDEKKVEQALKIAKNDLEIAVCILKLYVPK